MTFRRIAYFSIVALFLCAVAALGWHSLASLAVVHTQPSSSATPAPPPQQQGSAAAPQTTPPAAAPDAQQPAPQSPDNTHAIKAETNEVRVDVVVTDKKGNYITDLTQKDFKVYEDNKEQAVNSFSFGADPNAPVKNQRHYLVLFFDNTSMELSDQPRARDAAAKFIEAHAGPDQVMSVMNFGGSLQIVQNFTTDADRLKQAVSGISNSNISSVANSSAGTDALQYPGMANFGNSEAQFGTYTLLLSIRNLAKNLASIPGRKSLILFTAGFALDGEVVSELTATIDACNKANVAVYPLDVRGLIAPVPSLGDQLFENAAPDAKAQAANHRADSMQGQFTYATFHPRSAASSAPTYAIAPSGVDDANASLQLAAFHPDASIFLAAFQHGGGGGGGGGHGGGGGVGGGTGGGGSTGGGGKGGTGGTGTGGTGGKGGTGGGGTSRGVGTPFNNNPYNQASNIVPPFPPSASTNQQVLYELASGTGGFPILNTNDLLPGLEKISREQNQYYLLGYTRSEEHTSEL